MSGRSEGMEFKKDKEKKENKFLVGLMPSSDGDLLHLSEGTSSDLGLGLLEFETEE